MTHTQSEKKRQESLTRSGGRLPRAGVLLGGMLLVLNPLAAFAHQDSAEVPEKMAYVPLVLPSWASIKTRQAALRWENQPVYINVE